MKGPILSREVEKLTVCGRRVKFGKFANFLLLDEITPDSVYPMKPDVYESFVTLLENLSTTTEGIILTGSVADVLGRSPF
jgi:hypothetical protein